MTVASRILTTGTAYIDSGTGTLTQSSVIGGASSVAKVGSGDPFFNSVSTYTGDTSVGAGRLTVAGCRCRDQQDRHRISRTIDTAGIAQPLTGESEGAAYKLFAEAAFSSGVIGKNNSDNGVKATFALGF